jgi:hypothetical protein
MSGAREHGANAMTLLRDSEISSWIGAAVIITVLTVALGGVWVVL